MNVASNGLLVATVATGAVIVTTTALTGYTTFPVPIINSQKAYCTYGAIVQPPPAAAGSAPSAVPGLLVANNSIWKYLDDGTDQGTAWRVVGFDDANWLAGPARLGFGEGTESTVAGYGSNITEQNITTYFRRSFRVTNAWAVTNLQVALLCKDGGVVYLNGIEIFRCNLTNNPVTSTSLAATNYTSTPRAFTTNAVVPALLVNGTNVLAVEIHLYSTNRSSLSFDLALAGGATAEAPKCTLASSGVNLVLSWPNSPPGFIPYMATDLSPQAVWSPLSNIGQFSIGIDRSPGMRFFRLVYH
ncbi:MAG: hypothetical protein NTW03_01540 [Verrucomicrobia bacterium]|nr:hypothetical protein [Verrucomicrobiota bacterium]